MRRFIIIQWAIAVAVFCAALPAPAQPVLIEKERAEFIQLIKTNPEYFVKIKPMALNMKYEQLQSVGLLPEQDLLKAVIHLKLSYGYNGSLCSTGSIEYVRFFIDWDGNGSYADAGEDMGISAVNVHDIPDMKYPCLTSAADSKPISFSLTRSIHSRKKPCVNENLVKVKAILSWNREPTAGDPGFKPVWGNSVESWIQIKPHWAFQVQPVDSVLWSDTIFDEKQVYEKAIPSFKEPVAVPDLKMMYKDFKVPETRFNFAEIKAKGDEVKANPDLRKKYKQNPQTAVLLKNIDVLLAQQFNTTYEELKNVGLDYDLSSVSAVLTVKKPWGYSGTLCKKGSIEYIGFWAYVRDDIEQMCLWKFLGLGRVNVHDIQSIPAGGLQYAVYAPVDFTKLQSACEKPQVLKIRALLSWNEPIAAGDYNKVPAWGNRIETQIQLKPGVSNTAGKPFPYLWSLAHMPVENISGNAYTVAGSSLGDGYANHLSTDGWTALESPFGGSVTVSGTIAGMPDISSGAAKLKYKVQYKKSTDPAWQDMANTFTIYRRVNGVPAGSMNQVAVNGYFTYEKDLTGPTIIEVQDDVLAWFSSGALTDGLACIRVLVEQPGAAPLPDVPAGHVSSDVVKIMVDNTVPNPVNLTMDAGTCNVYQPGDSITGKFTAMDKHFGGYVFYLLPYSFPPSSFVHVPAATTYTGLPSGLPASGVPLGTYGLATAKLKPCGYVLKMDVYDRAIVGNSLSRNWNSASVGFCLFKKP